ncbi:MAG: hypothetical protein CFE29_04055 [Bradyrhizobiaceae bacterium PARB1]|nr:MAG: hypothetical protein CFE29_04055 [Bradyrhizobiaceae bacterium PARB1]
MKVAFESVPSAVELSEHHQRLFEARPTKNATTIAARGAWRTILLKVSSELPGFRPSSIAPFMVLAADFTVSVTVEVTSDSCSVTEGV